MTTENLMRLSLVVQILAAGVSHVAAEVTFTGTVSPETPGAVSEEDVVVIGPYDDGSYPPAPVVDPRGSILIDGGSQVEAGRLLNGDNHEALTSLRITGAGSLLRLNAQGDESNPTLGVGRQGSGYLRIDDGAWVDVDSYAGVMAIGSDDFYGTNVAEVEVLGEGTLLTVGQQLSVGFGVSSRLSVLDGAVVRARQRIDLSGVVEVSGSRSQLQTQQLTLGSPLAGISTGRDGELHVRDGAVVRPVTPGFLDRAEIGLGGRVVLDQGTFAIHIDQMLGVLEGSGTFSAGVQVGREGTVRAGSGDTLEFLSGLRSSGSVEATEATLNVFRPFENQSASGSRGHVDFRQSQVLLAEGITNDGLVELKDSSLRVAEEFINQSGDLIAVNSQLEFATGYATNDGRLELIDSELLLTGSSSLSNDDSRLSEGGGRIVLENSLIGRGRIGDCCGPAISNRGVIEARAGTNVVRGSVDSLNGALEVGPGAAISFGADADFYGGVTIAEGGAASFAAYAHVQDVSVDLSSTNLVQPSLTATGAASEGFQEYFYVRGHLIVDAEGLVNLEAGQVYKLIEADQLLAFFSPLDLPELPGTLEFLPELTDTALSLRVIDSTVTLPGDFSGDGVVDAADYTLWRDGLPGASQRLDKMLWRENFGRTLAPPDTASVPEPAALAAALLGVLAGCGFRRVA